MRILPIMSSRHRGLLVASVLVLVACHEGQDSPKGCELSAASAASVLLAVGGGAEVGETRAGADDGGCIAFFGASDGRSEARTVVARGRSSRDAAHAAARRWSEVTGRGIDAQVWLKLDVVAELISFADPNGPASTGARHGSEFSESRSDALPPVRQTAFQSAEPSLYGVADAEFQVALLPEEIMAHRMVDERHRFRLLHYDTFRARHPDRATEDPPPWAWRFRSRSYFLDLSEPEPRVRRLFRGQHAEVPTDVRSLEARAVWAMDYLKRAVADDGRFAYSYSPVADRIDTSYNMVRHAGAVYAMLELVARQAQIGSPDLELLAAAERATDYLVQEIRPCPRLRYEPQAEDVPDHHRRHGLCLVEANESKLGGHGLAALALLQHPDIANRTEHLEVAVGLGERILSVLRPDGRFDPHKVRWSDGTHFRFESEYYPGEAIYALTRLFRVTGERRWIAAARRASDFRVRERYAEDGDFTDETLPHDHWLSYGLRELAELDPRPWDAAYLRRLSRLIVDAQHRDVDPPDWAGGFYEPPRSAPTATRAEALGSILTALAGTEPGLAEELDGLGAALCRALAFQLRAQYTAPRVIYYAEPRRALGGIAGGLTDDEIRIDYPQHTSSSLVTAVGLMERGVLSCPDLDVIDL